MAARKVRRITVEAYPKVERNGRVIRVTGYDDNYKGKSAREARIDLPPWCAAILARELRRTLRIFRDAEVASLNGYVQTSDSL